MLTFEIDETNEILHVTETIMSPNKTKISHWYHNIKTWMVSSQGREGDAPDRSMTKSSIEWVKKHYLPKVQPQG
jgi:hypothetical protein